MKQAIYKFSNDNELKQIDVKPSTALRIAADTFFNIRKYTLTELKGLFTADEITAMADAANGLMQNFDYIASKNMFVTHVKDGEQLEGLLSRHNIVPPTFYNKLEKLTAAQVAVLQLEFSIFWNNEDPDSYGAPVPDLEKLTEKLVK